MAPIDDAIAAFNSQDEGEKLTLQACADRFGVNRSTLGRRLRGATLPKQAADEGKQLLNPQQEHELVLYIEKLTKEGLPPTRSMVQNLASEVAKTRVSESWVSRFLHRNNTTLIPKWTSGMDRDRHKADSSLKYNLYYDLLHSKMSEYQIIPENTYNMDEKGFLIGITKRTKRVFSKR